MDSRMLGGGLGAGLGGGIGSGLAGLFGGLFGDSGSPYEDAMKQYEKWANQAAGYQNPFFNAGKGAIPRFNQYLNRMKDPSQFINNLMGGYQESPFAKFQQQQGMRAAENLGSASGLTGSTPLQMQAQQNAQNISSQDMNQWLQNVLGVNTQYGQGLGGLMQGGQNAANAMTNLYGNLGQQMGEAAYGRRAGQLQDRSNIFGGLFSLLGF